MKNWILGLVACLGVYAEAKAEYNGAFYQFEIEMQDGFIDTGYCYIADAYIHADSLNNSTYFKNRIYRSWYYDQDSLSYFQHFFSYQYKLQYSSDVYTEYLTMGKVSVQYSKVKTVRFLKAYSSSYLSDIGSFHAPEDTIWMKNPPVDTFSVAGYLCGWNIFIHETNLEVADWKQKVQKKANELWIEYDELGEDLSYNRSDSARKSYSEFEDELDSILSDYVFELTGQKVVIIAECSC